MIKFNKYHKIDTQLFNLKIINLKLIQKPVNMNPIKNKVFMKHFKGTGSLWILKIKV